jgi:phenylpropionate dioxygenase-like ring-hydroxylating dioxygenase large terminal subunit
MVSTPGAAVDEAPLIPEVDFSGLNMRVSTERYHSRDYHRRERDNLWMKVWQIAGRADEIPEPGDWFEFRRFDQSWVLVRGRDGKVRGFVNACRHRGNAFCEGKGHAARFTCPYHNWSYGLDGQLLAVAKPDFEGTTEEFVGDKRDLGLIEVPVECALGFVWLNPDPAAGPLKDFLGEAGRILSQYHMEEMVPVGFNVRERLECNWKVMMDAFGEGYHSQAVHPELTGIVDMTKERFFGQGDHCCATVPFGAPGLAELGPEGEAQAYLNVPAENFPGFAEVLPRFAALLEERRGENGALALPAGETVRLLLERAVRATLAAKGLDTQGLTDKQMVDFQFWLLFPNVFIQICAGEATVIMAEPDPDGDPGRCFWRVNFQQYLPPEHRAAARLEVQQIAEGDHFPYFLALEQDYVQMPIQQLGLRNRAMTEMALTKQEPRVAHFHGAVDRWVG